MPRYSASSFRTLGNASTTQNLLTIENTHATRIVRIRALSFLMDATAVLTAVMPQIKVNRCSVPSGGTALTKVRFNTAEAASDSTVVVRGATASDGGSATAITATPGDLLWQQIGMRLHTAVGQVLGIEFNLLPPLIENSPIVLRQNEAIVVNIVATAGTSNPNTNHYIVSIVWDEDAS